MVSLPFIAFQSHIFQIGVSIVALGLSVFLIVSRNSLLNRSQQLSALYGDTTVDVNLSWKYAISSLAAAGFTVVSHIITASLEASCAKKSQKTAALRQGSRLTTVMKVYMIMLYVFEVLAAAFWFVNVILFCGSYATQSCMNLNTLIKTYHLSTITSQDYASSFYQRAVEGVTSAADNSTDANLSTSMLQTEILLRVSANCQMKKAVLSLSAVMLFSYLLTLGLSTAGAVRFWSHWKAAPVELRDDSVVLREKLETPLDKSLQREDSSSDEEDEVPETQRRVRLLWLHKWAYPEVELFKDMEGIIRKEPRRRDSMEVV